MINEELWIKNTCLIFNVKDFKLNLSNIKAIKKIMNEFNDPFIIFFHLLRFVNPLYEEVLKIPVRSDYRETGTCKCNCDLINQVNPG